jgi:hypothetical protein
MMSPNALASLTALNISSLHALLEQEQPIVTRASPVSVTNQD